MRNIVTGLDIGTAAIRIVVAEWKRGKNTPHILALVKKPARGIRRGYITHPEEAAEMVAQALQEAERAAKTRIKQAIIGLSGVTLSSKVMEGSTAIARGDMELSELDIERALDAAAQLLPDRENNLVLHRFPISFKVDGKKVAGRPEGLKGNKLEVRAIFITYSQQHLKDLTQVLETAGLRTANEDFVASPLAASLPLLSKVQKTAGVVLANIGAQTTSIGVFEEGVPVSMQVFPLGSTDVTNDIALGFKITLEEAEQVKRGETEAGPRKKLDEIIEARLLDIFQLIETHLRKISRSGLLPAGIVLTGGGAATPGIEILARDYFKLPARTAESSIAAASKNQIKDSAWAVAYGLTYFGSDLAPETGSTSRLAGSFLKYLRELLP